MSIVRTVLIGFGTAIVLGLPTTRNGMTTTASNAGNATRISTSGNNGPTSS